MYRVGPVDRPLEYHDLAGPDIAAVLADAHRHWPDEPLFCRELGRDALPQAARADLQPDGVGYAASDIELI